MFKKLRAHTFLSLSRLFLTTEPPLFATEFLHRMVNVLEDYFDRKISEKVIRREAVLVYQVSEGG